MPASSTPSAARRGYAPRASTSAISSISSGSPEAAMGTSGATSAHLSLERALERLQDIGERLQLLGCQRVNKMLLDRSQVGRTRTPERRCAAFRERHLGPAIVGGAVVAPDE